MAISLNDHEQRIKNAELELPKISSRIDNLVGSGKDWMIINLSTSTKSASIPSKFASCKMAVISCSISARTKEGNPYDIVISNNGSSQMTLNGYIGTSSSVPKSHIISKSSTSISFNGAYGNYSTNLIRLSISILLYK